MNFVISLSEVNEYNVICVIVDQLSKKCHYIFTMIIVDVEGVIRIYIDSV